MTQRLTTKAGRYLIEQGNPAHEAYYIEKGRVEVSFEEDGHILPLGEAGAGEVVGEMAIINDLHRVASVRALENCEVVVISRDDLEGRLNALDDDILKTLIRSLIRRLKTSNVSQMKHYKTLNNFQDRLCGLMEKAENGIDRDRREDFAATVLPLLDSLEAALEKYKKP